MTDSSARISPADIESKFRSVQTELDVTAEDGKKKALIGGVVIGAIILLVVYMLGQRSGRLTNTVLEVRRL